MYTPWIIYNTVSVYHRITNNHLCHVTIDDRCSLGHWFLHDRLKYHYQYRYKIYTPGSSRRGWVTIRYFNVFENLLLLNPVCIFKTVSFVWKIVEYFFVENFISFKISSDHFSPRGDPSWDIWKSRWNSIVEYFWKYHFLSALYLQECWIYV